MAIDKRRDTTVTICMQGTYKKKLAILSARTEISQSELYEGALDLLFSPFQGFDDGDKKEAQTILDAAKEHMNILKN